jgi:uncharacterized membrane protein
MQPQLSPGDETARRNNRPTTRIESVDALRGVVMILMALDHVRDFFHRGAMTFSPTDLSKTTPILFLTRWITHFCLPVFMFTAGAGAFLWWRRRERTRGELARFLWTRGIWFVLLELTVMQFAYNFNFSGSNLVLLLILWIFGICMLAMAALVYLPVRWLTIFGVAVVAGHNFLGRFRASDFGSGVWAWMLLHQPGILKLGSHAVLVTYTILPWIGVMALGFCFGAVLLRPPDQRRRLMWRIGLTLIAAFFVIRSIDRYGDPAPWSGQNSPVFTILSFLNCTKYPASLDFLLMTIGPALIALAWLDRHPLSVRNPVTVFGRVPFFYFVLHFYLIHLLVVLAAFLKYGATASAFIFQPLPSMGGPAQLFPSPFGYELWVVYLVWLFVVASLYPVCRWYASVKACRRDWWLGYL